MSPKSVAVVGGGVSGLAAAHHLLKLEPDLNVHLFEAGARLGGVIQTTAKDGFLIENAADNFITTSPTALELCQDLGLGHELVQTNAGGGGAMVVSRGQLEPIPPGFMVMAPSRLWPILATRILSPMGKLRSAMEVFVPRKRSSADESLEAFICRRFGTEMFERLVQPLVGSIYTADPSRLSVAATMPRFLDMERKHGSLIRGMMADRRKQAGKAEDRGGARYSQFMTLRGGMSSLIDALARQLPEENLHLNSPVRCVMRNEAGWRIQLECGRESQADAVLVASPANQASNILRRVDARLSSRLGQIDYASCAIVSLAFRLAQVETPLQSFGFVVPRVENHAILSCSFSSEKYAGRAPQGTLLMRVFIGGAMQPGLLRLPDRSLMQLAHREVAKLLKIKGEPILRHVVRQVEAMPQYHVGHNQLVAEINERVALYPRLALAGSSLSGVGVPGCIASGQKAAARIVAGLSTAATAATAATASLQTQAASAGSAFLQS